MTGAHLANVVRAILESAAATAYTHAHLISGVDTMRAFASAGPQRLSADFIDARNFQEQVPTWLSPKEKRALLAGACAAATIR